jgi:hypothetical protein
MSAPAKGFSLIPNDTGIEPNYRHAPKRVVPGPALETPGATFKWYAVEAPDLPVPEAIAGLARAYLTNNALEARGLGFVILHRCGKEFYFLLVSAWRGNNEVWETVFYKDGDAMADFSVFPREGMHKPTFCVWELAAVWHEKQAWERFLMSARDEAAAQVWLRDLYTGQA